MKTANAATIVARMGPILMRLEIAADMVRSRHSSAVLPSWLSNGRSCRAGLSFGFAARRRSLEADQEFITRIASGEMIVELLAQDIGLPS
jgi:hypothetical protein